MISIYLTIDITGGPLQHVMRQFSWESIVSKQVLKKKNIKNSKKKRKDVRGNAGGLRQHMITENSWEMKVCPLHPSSCPKQPVLQSPTSLSFVLTKKSWQTIFVGLNSNAK